MISSWLKEKKEKILVLMVMDDERREINGFIITIIPDDVSYSFILQCWISPKLRDSKVVDEMFREIVRWSESFGRFEIRFETERDELRAFERRWRFRKITTILRFVTDDLEIVLRDHQRRRTRKERERKLTCPPQLLELSHPSLRVKNG